MKFIHIYNFSKCQNDMWCCPTYNGDPLFADWHCYRYPIQIFQMKYAKMQNAKCQTDMWCCPTIVTLPPRAGYTSFQNHSLNPKQRPWIRFSSQISQDFLRTLLPCVLWPSLQLFLVGIVTIGFPRIVSYYLFAAIFIALPQDKKRLLVESTHMMYF